MIVVSLFLDRLRQKMAAEAQERLDALHSTPITILVPTEHGYVCTERQWFEEIKETP